MSIHLRFSQKGPLSLNIRQKSRWHLIATCPSPVPHGPTKHKTKATKSQRNLDRISTMIDHGGCRHSARPPARLVRRLAEPFRGAIAKPSSYCAFGPLAGRAISGWRLSHRVQDPQPAAPPRHSSSHAALPASATPRPAGAGGRLCRLHRRPSTGRCPRSPAGCKR